VPNSTPRVAVIIACFNDGATLPDAVASLEGQEPHELVVVDDGSDDPDTLQVLRELEGRGVRVLRQENQGPAAARTAGLHATTAPYVRLLDADDVDAPGAITALANALDEAPGVAVVWGDVRTFGAFDWYERSAPDLDPWLITYVNEIQADALIRRDALEEVGGWQLKGGYEDWDLWLALAERGWKGRHVPVLAGWYRIHGSQRVQARAVRRHDELIGEMRRRHRALYEARPRNRRTSRAPLRAKLLFPLIDRLPARSDYARLRLHWLVLRPVDSIQPTLARLRRKRALDSAA
jgi:glycosyltransferase involved in cell wall biosynthesis